MSTQDAHMTRSSPQLSLPLPGLECSSHLPPEPPALLPQHLWMSLSLTTRAQVCHTILRIIQEVLHDAPRA